MAHSETSKPVVLTDGRQTPAPRHGLIFVGDDWKKKDGFKHSIELSRELGLYRQDYCGCEFSRRPERGNS